MTEKFFALLLALLAASLLLTACGDDDGNTAAAADSAEVSEDGGIDQVNLEAFIAAVYEGPSLLCDLGGASLGSD